MTAGTQAGTEETEESPDEPKRKFKFPTAFTVLFFVLVLIWILTFIIPPGSYSYVSCDGGTPKPIPGTFGAVKVDLSFQERLYDLWVSPVNGLYGVRTPSEVVPDPSPELLKKGQAGPGDVQQARLVTADPTAPAFLVADLGPQALAEHAYDAVTGELVAVPTKAMLAGSSRLAFIAPTTAESGYA